HGVKYSRTARQRIQKPGAPPGVVWGLTGAYEAIGPNLLWVSARVWRSARPPRARFWACPGGVIFCQRCVRFWVIGWSPERRPLGPRIRDIMRRKLHQPSGAAMQPDHPTGDAS